ncbi:MAG: prolipoprotein diacylglyceryl transferase [Rikenellaceae bacterium]
MFDLLYIDWHFDPVAFSIFGLEVRYYGLMWALTIFVGTKIFDYFCRHEGLDQRVSESIFIYGTFATIIGSRVGHCLFYEPEYYLSNPLEIITGIRDGGMASHGAAIGLLIGLWLFSRKNRLPFVWSLDRIMVVVGLGGALVRFGNLFNSEIFGCVTDLPWGFRFHDSALWVREISPLPVHPTQLYEAIFYLITFVVLIVMYAKFDMARRRPGVMFGVAMQGVFLTRFFVEFIKLRQVDFEHGMSLDMGQWLSIPFVVLGLVMIFRGLKKSV